MGRDMVVMGRRLIVWGRVGRRGVKSGNIEEQWLSRAIVWRNAGYRYLTWLSELRSTKLSSISLK